MVPITELFAGNIIFSLQLGLLGLVLVFIISEVQIHRGRKISFNNFLSNVKYFDVPESRSIQVIIFFIMVSQFVLMLLVLFSGAYLYAIIYLINVAVSSILFMFSTSAALGNRNLEQFSTEFRLIKQMETTVSSHHDLINRMDGELNSYIKKATELRSEFSRFTTQPIFLKSKERIIKLDDALSLARKNDLAKQVQVLKEKFELTLITFINSNIVQSLNVETAEIPGVSQFEQLITSANDLLPEDIQDATKLIFSDFSLFDATSINELIDIATKHNISVTEEDIRRILDRISQLGEKEELLNRLYSSKAITPEIVSSYLEMDQEWIITQQMYSILSPGDLSSILILLVEKDLLNSTKRFLQSLPADKLQILFRVTGEVKNKTSNLIIEFRNFLPLKFLFSDPSTMYFNMYSALIDTDLDLNSIVDSSSLSSLRKDIIGNKDVIREKYQLSYEKSSNIRSRFESVKLNLLSSNLKNSALIRLESSIELFYQYVVSLRQKEAAVLFDFLESIFLVEETDKLKIEEFMNNKGAATGISMTTSKYVESGKAKLRQLLRTEKTLIQQIISRIEFSRLSFDKISELVKA